MGFGRSRSFILHWTKAQKVKADLDRKLSQVELWSEVLAGHPTGVTDLVHINR